MFSPEGNEMLFFSVGLTDWIASVHRFAASLLPAGSPTPFQRLVLVTFVVLVVSATPATAQIDLSGEWGATFHEDLPHRGGMRLGDYTGLPLNEAGWRKAHSWDEAARSTPERQCIPHVVTYALRGPATIRFLKVVDPVSGQLIAYNLHGSYGRPRTIWMDGRPHPSALAPHTWAGFSTGKWDRNTLVVTTTHIKVGWLQRNGAPTSDQTTMAEYFTRYGDYLMAVTFVNDPVYLDEPFIRTSNFVLSLPSNANAWGNCGPAQIIDELGGKPKGYVPHYLPGQMTHASTQMRGSKRASFALIRHRRRRRIEPGRDTPSPSGSLSASVAASASACSRGSLESAR